MLPRITEPKSSLHARLTEHRRICETEWRERIGMQGEDIDAVTGRHQHRDTHIQDFQRTGVATGSFVAQFHLSTDLSTHCLRTLNGAGTR